MAADPGDPIELYRAGGLPEAHAICVLLDAAGIPARVENELLQGVLGELPMGWDTAPRVIVARADEAAARAVLADFLRRDRSAEEVGEDGLRCLACGGPMGTADTCPGCGWSYRPAGEAPAAEPVPPDAPPPVPLPAGETAPPTPTGRAGWGEVAAVLAIGVVPNLAAAVVAVVAPGPPMPYRVEAVYQTVLSGCTLYVTLYLIGRGGPWGRFGITRPSAWDVPFGLTLFLTALALWRTLAWLLPDDPLAGTVSARPAGPADYAVMAVRYAAGAAAEEVVARCYLITRLTDLLGSRAEAVLLAAVAFASYHVYTGLAGSAQAFALGLVFGAAFLLFPRVWPLVIGHAAYNVCWELMAA